MGQDIQEWTVLLFLFNKVADLGFLSKCDQVGIFFHRKKIKITRNQKVPCSTVLLLSRILLFHQFLLIFSCGFW